MQKDTVEEIKKLLKSECITCDLSIKCSSCPFVKGDNGINCGQQFKQFGIYNYGKQYLFYFLHHPELNWKLPPIPECDYLGNKRIDRKIFCWIIHHEDGNHYNDNIWNQILCINTEHTSIHNYYNHPMKNPETAKKNSKSNKIAHKKLVNSGKHHMIINHPFKNKEVLERFSENQRQRIKDKNHIFVTDNPNYKNPKILNLENYLKTFNSCEKKVTNILAKDLGYSDYRSLIRASNTIIDRLKLNLKIEHRGKKYRGSWYLMNGGING